MKPIITVVIQAYNEEDNIKDCVISAKKLTHQVIVMDMQSSDKTVEIAKKVKATIVPIPHYDYVEPVRKLVFNHVQTDWVFILDADERIPPELSQEIQNLKLHISRFTHYEIPRQNIFAGKKWLKHGGWWPDKQVRLIQKKAFVEWPKQIHSPVIVNGAMGSLKSPIKHYFHPNLESMVQKTMRFEQIEAELLFQAGKTVNSLTPLRKFCGELMRRLIIKQGFRDGSYGIIESLYQAYSKSLTYLFLYEKQYQNKSK